MNILQIIATWLYELPGAVQFILFILVVGSLLWYFGKLRRFFK